LDRPNVETYALSLPDNFRTNFRITNNYLRSDFTGDWGINPWNAAGEKRFGYGIEGGGVNGLVQGNIVGGPNSFCNLVTSPMANLSVDGNEFYGKGIWGDFAGEPGQLGFGSIKLA